MKKKKTRQPKKCKLCQKYKGRGYNKETLRALKNIEEGKGLVRCESLKELLKKLGI